MLQLQKESNFCGLFLEVKERVALLHIMSFLVHQERGLLSNCNMLIGFSNKDKIASSTECPR